MTEAEAHKYQFYCSILKLITKEYRPNTNIDTVIRNVESKLNEHYKK